MQPSVGGIVHYVSQGTPLRPDGSQAFKSQCRAAVITEVEPDTAMSLVGLCVLNPTGLFFHSLADSGCAYDDGSGQAGDPECPNRAQHGNPFRYCSCGWTEPALIGGTWHWPERV